MTIREENGAEGVVLFVEGKLTTNTAPELEPILMEKVAAGGNVVLDFKQLDYLSSAGLRLLVGAQKSVNANGGSLTIRHCDDDVKEIFEITGLVDVLTIE